MLNLLNKPMCDVMNKRLQKILMRVQFYNFKPNHIAGTSNKIADALTRLCGLVAKTHHTPMDNIRLLGMSKKADIYRKQLEIEDPLVLQLGIQAGLDMEYVEMVNAIENRTEFRNLPDPTVP